MSVLTVEVLRDMQDKLRKLIDGAPPAVGFDLYGHDLADQEQAYIIDPDAPGAVDVFKRSSWLRGAANVRGRKMVVVPRLRLVAVFHQLLAAGVDVRLEPRYGFEPKPRTPAAEEPKP